MNTCLEGEERVLKISPFTLKKMAIATDKPVTLLSVPKLM